MNIRIKEAKLLTAIGKMKPHQLSLAIGDLNFYINGGKFCVFMGEKPELCIVKEKGSKKTFAKLLKYAKKNGIKSSIKPFDEIEIGNSDYAYNRLVEILLFMGVLFGEVCKIKTVDNEDQFIWEDKKKNFTVSLFAEYDEVNDFNIEAKTLDESVRANKDFQYKFFALQGYCVSQKIDYLLE